MKALTLPLKGEYFDQIKAGTKPEEYRLATDFWATRIVGREYDRIVLTRGYPKGGGIEGETRLTRKWCGYRTAWLTHPHFGPKSVQVFALDVSTPLEQIKAQGTSAGTAETGTGSGRQPAGPVRQDAPETSSSGD